MRVMKFNITMEHVLGKLIAVMVTLPASHQRLDEIKKDDTLN